MFGPDTGTVAKLDGTVVFSDLGSLPQVSPSGRYVSVDPDNICRYGGNSSLLLYDGTMLANSVPGCTHAWLDDSRLLADNWMFNGGESYYDHTTIYDPVGDSLGTFSQQIGNDFYLSPSMKALAHNWGNFYSLPSGTEVWTLPGGSQNGIAFTGAGVVSVSPSGSAIWTPLPASLTQ